MNTRHAMLCVGVLSLSGGYAAAGEPIAQGAAVLSQDLAPSVLWTRRTDRYTLQIVSKWRVVAAPAPQSGTRRELPLIEARLLDKNGRAIPPFQRWQTPTPKPSVTVPASLRPEVLYGFPLSGGAEAVAAEVCIDGHCTVHDIAPFKP